ncbi:RagB/SusD family nutrient uptake outer membrane protein [Pedobacter sp. PLR]|uniref:RagB/SusD family nutrient uptake outer membrane protein n=1 Tax=Pedobacter sp. PLR TaxID=2994465 RepID=UPI00224819BF|nr:RagB/SusD family nutrient uptake outer membrane protein [Pedobacter sp. PLR]MCX2451595.1 RagB/SusD family nutrient uptake outer membrane protein [Pedobacter sp. PLR]
MKNLHKLYLPLGVLILSFGSCKKEYLDVQPTNLVDTKAVFITTANAMSALNGIHRSLYIQYSRQEEGGQGSVNLNVDYMGNDLVNSVSTTAHNVYKWVSHKNATNGTNNYFYTFYYRIIENANMIIDGIDAADGTEATKKLIKGEALAYRAWAHFVLVQTFGKRYDKGAANTQAGIPIKISSILDAGLPRSSVEEVYKQINADLDASILLLTGATARTAKSHLDLSVAKGLKARVALTQGLWAVAAQNAAEARPGYTLMSNADYLKGFNSLSNSEWMWGSAQQEDQTTFFYSFFAYMGTYASTANRSNPKRINSALYTKIAATDVRKGLWDPTGTNTAFPIPAQGIRSTYMQRKFTNAGTTSIGDVVNMRVAEMYLIEAEAKAHLAVEGNAGENINAQNALFTLAKNRDASYVLSTNTGAALLNEILIQRRVELWGEGFGFFDLKRLNLPVDRTGGNATLAISGVLTVPAGGNEWQWSIPQAEIDANKAIGPAGQNP